MTEDQAKQKLCPMFDGWKDVGEKDFYKCKGSACMMWRKVVQYPSDYKVAIKFYPDGQESVTDNSISFGGYCGLAGKV